MMSRTSSQIGAGPGKESTTVQAVAHATMIDSTSQDRWFG